MDRREAIEWVIQYLERAKVSFPYEDISERVDFAIEALSESIRSEPIRVVLEATNPETLWEQGMKSFDGWGKQVTGKLKKPCDSLLKPDSDECKEQKSKLDCISRADAIAYIDRITNSGLGRNKSLDYIRKYISALPSVNQKQITGKLENAEIATSEGKESTMNQPKSKLDCISRQDAIEVVHKYFADAIDKTPHETDEDGDDVYTDMKAVNELLKHNKHISKAIKALPPVTPTVSEDCIDREQFREQMFHRCFEVDNDPNMQKWESGNWIRWKLFEEELENAPSVTPTEQQKKEKEHDAKSICHTCATNNCPFQSGIYRNNCDFYTSVNKGRR